jgi:hypothetical protein
MRKKKKLNQSPITKTGEIHKPTGIVVFSQVYPPISIGIVKGLSVKPSIHPSRPLNLAFRNLISGSLQRIRRVRKRLLDPRPGLSRNVEFCKSGPGKLDIEAGSVKNLLGGRNGRGEVCIFREARDEEHEAAGFDLHFGKVCYVWREVGVFSALGS